MSSRLRGPGRIRYRGRSHAVKNENKEENKENEPGVKQPQEPDSLGSSSRPSCDLKLTSDTKKSSEIRETPVVKEEEKEQIEAKEEENQNEEVLSLDEGGQDDEPQLENCKKDAAGIEKEEEDPKTNLQRFMLKAPELKHPLPLITGEEVEEKLNKALRNLARVYESQLNPPVEGKDATELHEVPEIPYNPGSDPEEFYKRIAKINIRSNLRVAEYNAMLTPEVLYSRSGYLKDKKEFEELMKQGIISYDTDSDVPTDDEDADDGDDDTQQDIPELDPITKKPLEDPVRNSICKHVYGKAAMLTLIKKDPTTRCPTTGCVNEEYVKAKDLIEVSGLTAKIRGSPLPSTTTSLRRSARLRAQTPRKKILGRRRKY